MTSNDLPASAETQSHKDRPRTVTVTEQDAERLAIQYCARRTGEHLEHNGKFPCQACLLHARVFLASLPDAPPEARGYVVGHQIIPFADAPPSAPDIEAIQELAARHCTGTPDCPVPHGAVDRVALFWPFTSVIEPNAAPDRDGPEAG
jgi:hypothetical protein